MAALSAESVLAEADAKATRLVSRMTLDEKFAQLVNVAPAIPRLDVPAYNWWTESLHGAIGATATTNFPEPIGLAATFNTPLVQNVAGAVSVEVRALHMLGRKTGHLGVIGTGLDTWSPNINIFRDPRWGRGQETYGEDPFLTARMGVSFVSGMQGPDPNLPYVIATPKHFAVHSGPESSRHVADVPVTAHDLEDTYLPAFRAAIVEGHAGSIMCAYNSIGGQPACANDILLKEHLRGDWGFTGYVVSDCDAVRDIADNHQYVADQAHAVAAALKSGVDNECVIDKLFDIAGPVERYKEAHARGLISMNDINRALVRLFSARLRNGDLPGLNERGLRQVPVDEIGVPAHRKLAQKAAAQSLVLLKNDGVLPLKPDVKIAVIGPHGDSTRVLRGNYSSELSGPAVSVLEGLRRALPGVVITHAPFSPTPMDGDSVPTSALQTPDGHPGLLAQYYNSVRVTRGPFANMAAYGAHMAAITYADRPTLTRVEPNVGGHGGELKSVTEDYRIVWTGYLTPPTTGTYRIGLTEAPGELDLDGKVVSKPVNVSFGDLPELTTVRLEKGRRYAVRISSTGHAMPGPTLLWKQVAESASDEMDGVADASLIVAVVGLSSDLEGEEMKRKIDGFTGGDKTSLDLPADQQKLLERAAKTGKPLVVVLMNGSPLDLSWAKENTSAILEAWYPGQEGGLAVAKVLAGQINPAGRLPLTFYRSVADLPPFDDYNMAGRTYRYFTGQPVYPFGYGLSYTHFSYGALIIEPLHGAPENGLRVSCTVANIGGTAGDEVAELYIQPPPFKGFPRVALRGFERLTLAPGEHRKVTFDLSPRDLSFVDTLGARRVMAGQYSVSIGSGQPGTGVPVQMGSVSLTNDAPIPR
jgi:beta-glucosidase